ncbi:hypothetical protein ZWY2020_033346 [Hordeum vulgare]|nr:hypothetical protein ZWY2020_033346 [Hordeum vulgare]
MGTLAPVVVVGTELSLPASPIPVVAAEEEVSVVWRSALLRPRARQGWFATRALRVPPFPDLGVPGSAPSGDLVPGWVPESPPVPRSRPREGTSPVMATRQSARISQSRTLQDGRVPTIPELAARRAAARDLFPGGERSPS